MLFLHKYNQLLLWRNSLPIWLPHGALSHLSGLLFTLLLRKLNIFDEVYAAKLNSGWTKVKAGTSGERKAQTGAGDGGREVGGGCVG